MSIKRQKKAQHGSKRLERTLMAANYSPFIKEVKWF